MLPLKRRKTKNRIGKNEALRYQMSRMVTERRREGWQAETHRGTHARRSEEERWCVCVHEMEWRCL